MTRETDQINYLAAALATDQIILRTLAVVLVVRELKHSENAAKTLREITEEWHRAIDLYGTTGATPAHLMEIDKEKARVNVDAVSATARTLLKLP